MPHYIVYKQLDGISLNAEESDEPKFIFIDEDKIKTGLVEPRNNPLIGHDPDGEITADSVEQAEAVYRERRFNAFG